MVSATRESSGRDLEREERRRRTLRAGESRPCEPHGGGGLRGRHWTAEEVQLGWFWWFGVRVYGGFVVWRFLGGFGREESGSLGKRQRDFCRSCAGASGTLILSENYSVSSSPSTSSGVT